MAHVLAAGPLLDYVEYVPDYTGIALISLVLLAMLTRAGTCSFRLLLCIALEIAQAFVRDPLPSDWRTIFISLSVALDPVSFRCPGNVRASGGPEIAFPTHQQCC
jgi:hypothetical protein